MAAQATQLGYRAFWEPGAEDDARTVLALHGTGGDETSFGPVARQLAPGAAVLAPRGDVSEMGAARFFRRQAEGVYDMADLARAIDKFDAWLEPALSARGRDLGGAIGLGFSNGANLLAAHAFARPGRIKRLALLRPLIPYAPPEGDLSGVAVLIAAGRMDPIAPVAATEALAQAFVDRGAAVDLRWANAGHGLTSEEAALIAEALR